MSKLAPKQLSRRAAWRYSLAAFAGWSLMTPSHADSYVDFFRAVNIDNLRTVRQLVERGFDVNARSEQGQCALYLALREEAHQVSAWLMQWPQTDLNARNAAGETPLMMAALKGQVEAMRILLDKGVPAHHDGWSPLHYAATGKSVEAVRLLLDRGAPVDALSPNGSTPLQMAARYGDERSVELLVARGADLSHRNQLGQSADDFALGADREWMLKTLTRLRLRAR